MKVASSPCTIRMKPVSRRRAHSGASVPPDWGWLALHPSTNNYSMLVCTLLQSRKVLVCVVWTTSNALRSHWMRHRPTAAAGRLHTITSRELGPVAHARPPSMAYAPLSPYDRPLPCHQTRPANSNSTLLSSASDRRSARRFIALLRPTPLFYYYQIRTLCLLSPLAPSHHYVSITGRRKTCS
jgi:hypothetical protein